jgi:hypothetical protein
MSFVVLDIQSGRCEQGYALDVVGHREQVERAEVGQAVAVLRGGAYVADQGCGIAARTPPTSAPPNRPRPRGPRPNRRTPRLA